MIKNNNVGGERRNFIVTDILCMFVSVTAGFLPFSETLYLTKEPLRDEQRLFFYWDFFRGRD